MGKRRRNTLTFRVRMSFMKQTVKIKAALEAYMNE